MEIMPRIFSLKLRVYSTKCKFLKETVKSAIPGFIERVVVCMGVQCCPVLSILAYLEKPVTKCGPIMEMKESEQKRQLYNHATTNAVLKTCHHFFPHLPLTGSLRRIVMNVNFLFEQTELYLPRRHMHTFPNIVLRDIPKVLYFTLFKSLKP